ncbi:carboxynorspermidine decarboxylase [Candidatus Omnitrophus magneticus]|uniref:Carboxynorspermidine decarboxylase n=1 Tax=Candidatus Omnitrophus magneticus TaxID=1609969 RepID=A0A0F0CP08_9BACT|nr:carboxynorspermidine decarboxylase [Candidatus Omnitrophus magneticus]
MSCNFNAIASQLKETPCYVVDLGALKKNLEILKSVQLNAPCDIILALKGFSMFSVFPVIRNYLKGITASSLHEARLGYEEFGKDVHVYAPAYREDEFDELLRYATHITFNSFSQWEFFKPFFKKSGKNIKAGLRVNPEHSEVKVPLYDPCAPFSRLGIPHEEFKGKSLDGITGIHFHTLCELNSDALERTLTAVEKKFGDIIKNVECAISLKINFFPGVKGSSKE